MRTLFLILCFGHVTFTVSSEIIENYVRKHKWNQDLLSNLEDDYEVVYPFQLRDRTRTGIETKNYYYTNATYHFESATFVIRSSFKRFKLLLRLNQELIPNGAIYRQVLRPESLDTPSGRVANCFYQGQIHGESTSAVALSSCDGLRAVIFSGNETYTLVPLKGGDSGRRHPHLFYKAKWHRKAGCADEGGTEWSRSLDRKHTYGRMMKTRHRRDSERVEKYLELALVADYNLAAQYDFNFDYLLPATLEIVNIVDLIYHQNLNTRISLVYLEAWMQSNVITLTGEITQTMMNFLEYSSRELYKEHKDAALFLTPHRFSRRENSISTSATVCTAKGAGVVQMSSEFRGYESAMTMIHNIGHILGMTHDNGPSCDCQIENGCAMRKSIGFKNEGFTHLFSQCSRNEYLSLLKNGEGRCLFNKPMQESTLNMCGNKKVDPGEECDCGSIEECDKIDPCCDPVTCKLKSEAQCASGPCCDGCKLKPAGVMCRSSTSECDVPETCDGKSGQCPADSRKLNGAKCADGEGVCYVGNCATRKKQCQAIWGKGATDSKPKCYEKFNLLGFQHGHCGKDEQGNYIKCDLRNARCGLLHCQNGQENAVLDSAGDALKTKIESGDTVVECKSVTDKTAGMVADGATCGSDGICLGGSCVPKMDIIPVEYLCPTNNVALECSAHGVCTTENWCYCNEGWSGTDCGIRSPVPSPDLGFGKENAHRPLDGIQHTKLDVSSMLIILGGVGGGIAVLLLFLLLCYRRRTTSALKAKKLAARMEAERMSESSADTAHRSIKFGSMPSYRDEKMRMKKKQRRTLHKIHEVSDERDSISNKSRESGEPSMLHPITPVRGIHSANNSAIGCNSHSERGILKQQADRTPGSECSSSRTPRARSEQDVLSPLLARAQHIGMIVSPNPGTASADGGYESEPPTYAAYRIFEKSLRKLEEYECNPYNVPGASQSSGGTPVLIRSPQSEYWDGRGGHIFVQRNPQNQHRHPRGRVPQQNGTHSTFSPPPLQKMNGYSHQQNPAIRNARGGYATDTEVGYTPQLTRRSSQDSSRGGSPQSSWRQNLGRESDADRNSPTNSVASSRQPQPLKLENIEYLLKQLDSNLSNSLSPTSSAEFSATEADKCTMEQRLQDEDLGSTTESHRDQASFMDAVHLERDNRSRGAMNGSECQFESYTVSAVQSFNCNNTTLVPQSADVSRYSNGSTERAGST